MDLFLVVLECATDTRPKIVNIFFCFGFRLFIMKAICGGFWLILFLPFCLHG